MIVGRPVELGGVKTSPCVITSRQLGVIRISEVGGNPVESRYRKVILHMMSPDEVEFSRRSNFPSIAIFG